MEKYRHSTLAAVVLGLGVLVSPDSLVLLGHFMGHSGYTGLWVLPFALALFLIIALSWEGGREETPFLLTVKIAVAVLLSTGVLVSAGFVFNEVFLYWFPNFGFAFLLLAFVFGIQLAGWPAVLWAQVAFVGIALAALGIVLIGGLVGIGSEGTGSESQMASLPGLGVLGLPLLLWVGFDLAGAVPRGNTGRVPFITAVAVAGFIFFFWGLVSISYVSLEKLSDSGVPHMKVARAVLGETGRILVGTAVISGSLAAVNALFWGGGHGVKRLAGQEALPRWIGKWTGKPFCMPVVLSLAVGLMMALGMAGSETLEVWIRAAFLLWLLGYAGKDRSVKGRLVGLVLIAGAGAVLFTGEAPLLTLFYMGWILGAGFILGWISPKFSHHQNKRS